MQLQKCIWSECVALIHGVYLKLDPNYWKQFILKFLLLALADGIKEYMCTWVSFAEGFCIFLRYKKIHIQRVS